MLVIARFMKDPKYLELDDNIKLLFEKRKNDYMKALAESVSQAPMTTQEGEIPQMGKAKPMDNMEQSDVM